MNRAELATSIAALSLTPFALAGCASPVSDIEHAVPTAVVASDANIVDAYVSVSSGLGGQGFWVRIYLDDTSDEAVIASVDAALEAAYRGSPVEPTSITLDVARAPRPEKVVLVSGALSLSDTVIDALGLRGRASDGSISLSADHLAERFGAWEAGR